MKLIIAGSRGLNPSASTISGLINLFKLNPKEIISGKCMGVDTSGEIYAKCAELSVKYFKANWNEYGASAGPRRNTLMAGYGDALLLIWDGESKGSKSMKAEMKFLKKPVYEVILRHED